MRWKPQQKHVIRWIMLNGLLPLLETQKPMATSSLALSFQE
jgi:hypothetical protein